MVSESKTLEGGRAFIDRAWQRLQASYAERGVQLHPHYAESMRRFVAQPSPEAVRAVIRTVEAMFANEDVLYARLLDVSREEACGASLLRFAAGVADGELAKNVNRHASDEQGHMVLFLKACDTVKPELQATRPVEFRIDAIEEIGESSALPDVRQLLCSMHFAETRNLMVLSLYKDILSESRKEFAIPLTRILASVANDEIFHSFYTGRFINQWLFEDVTIQARVSELVELYSSYWMTDIERIAAWFSGSAIARGPAEEAVMAA